MTRASIFFARESLRRLMDCRDKPGNDDLELAPMTEGVGRCGEMRDTQGQGTGPRTGIDRPAHARKDVAAMALRRPTCDGHGEALRRFAQDSGGGKNRFRSNI